LLPREKREVFIEAVKAVVGNKTPVVKGTKKRKKAKQHPATSPPHISNSRMRRKEMTNQML
jgi:hypothetical protein